MIYRTELLHECGLELPKHTFYVDNLFAFEPLPYVQNMYYLDVNFYRYFIGRDDQSVNERVMIKRIDQQIRVNKLMADAFHRCQFSNKHLKKYMLSYLDIITTVSSIMLVRAGTQEALDKKKNSWNTSVSWTAGCTINFATVSSDVQQIFQAEPAERCSWQLIKYARNSMDSTKEII